MPVYELKDFVRCQVDVAVGRTGPNTMVTRARPALGRLSTQQVRLLKRPKKLRVRESGRVLRIPRA